MQSIAGIWQQAVWTVWPGSMTRQNSHRMTESMEEIMDGWDTAKEHRVQHKSYCKYDNHSLFGQRDIMFAK
jgi:hypothetical protein